MYAVAKFQHCMLITFRVTALQQKDQFVYRIAGYFHFWIFRRGISLQK